jgi:hypothetical protein
MKNKLKDIAVGLALGLFAVATFLSFVVITLFLIWQGGMWLEVMFGCSVSSIMCYFI